VVHKEGQCSPQHVQRLEDCLTFFCFWSFLLLDLSSTSLSFGSRRSTSDNSWQCGRFHHRTSKDCCQNIIVVLAGLLKLWNNGTVEYRQRFRVWSKLWRHTDAGLKTWLKLMCFALAQEPGVVFRFRRVKGQEVGLGLVVEKSNRVKQSYVEWNDKIVVKVLRY
jgi:hypothetical protein